MRVLAIADGFSIANEPFMVAAVVALADRGHEVRVLGTEPGAALHPADRHRVGRAVRLVPRRRPGVRGLVRSGWLLMRGRQHDGARLSQMLAVVKRFHGRGAGWRIAAWLVPLITEDFDVLHFMAASDVALYGAIIDTVPEPTVVSCTGSDVRVLPLGSPWFRRSLPQVLGTADRVLCVSAELSEWAHRAGAPDERTEVLYHGIDTSFFTPTATARAGPQPAPCGW